MEKIPNFKSGEKGKNEYSAERVRMTNLMNRMSEIDEQTRPMMKGANGEWVRNEKYDSLSPEQLTLLSQERNKLLDEAQEEYTKSQTEGTLVEKRDYTQRSEDPDIERARQIEIARLTDSLLNRNSTQP